MTVNRYREFPWFAVLLILVGAALLLDRLAVVQFGFIRIVWSVTALFGLFKAVDGFTDNRRGRIFGGTVVFFYGLYFLFSTFDLIETRPHMFVPLSLLVLGAACLMVYLNNVREWLTLLLAVGLFGLGTASLLEYLHLYDFYDVWWLARRFWPVVLILIGLSMILKSRGERKRAG